MATGFTFSETCEMEVGLDYEVNFPPMDTSSRPIATGPTPYSPRDVSPVEKVKAKKTPSMDVDQNNDVDQNDSNPLQEDNQQEACAAIISSLNDKYSHMELWDDSVAKSKWELEVVKGVSCWLPSPSGSSSFRPLRTKLKTAATIIKEHLGHKGYPLLVDSVPQETVYELPFHSWTTKQHAKLIECHALNDGKCFVKGWELSDLSIVLAPSGEVGSASLPRDDDGNLLGVGIMPGLGSNDSPNSVSVRFGTIVDHWKAFHMRQGLCLAIPCLAKSAIDCDFISFCPDGAIKHMARRHPEEFEKSRDHSSVETLARRQYQDLMGSNWLSQVNAGVDTSISTTSPSAIVLGQIWRDNWTFAGPYTPSRTTLADKLASTLDASGEPVYSWAGKLDQLPRNWEDALSSFSRCFKEKGLNFTFHDVQAIRKANMIEHVPVKNYPQNSRNSYGGARGRGGFPGKFRGRGKAGKVRLQHTSAPFEKPQFSISKRPRVTYSSDSEDDHGVSSKGPGKYQPEAQQQRIEELERLLASITSERDGLRRRFGACETNVNQHIADKKKLEVALKQSNLDQSLLLQKLEAVQKDLAVAEFKIGQQSKEADALNESLLGTRDQLIRAQNDLAEYESGRGINGGKAEAVVQKGVLEYTWLVSHTPTAKLASVEVRKKKMKSVVKCLEKCEENLANLQDAWVKHQEDKKTRPRDVDRYPDLAMYQHYFRNLLADVTSTYLGILGSTEAKDVDGTSTWAHLERLFGKDTVESGEETRELLNTMMWQSSKASVIVKALSSVEGKPPTENKMQHSTTDEPVGKSTDTEVLLRSIQQLSDFVRKNVCRSAELATVDKKFDRLLPPVSPEATNSEPIPTYDVYTGLRLEAPDNLRASRGINEGMNFFLPVPESVVNMGPAVLKTILQSFPLAQRSEAGFPSDESGYEPSKREISDREVFPDEWVGHDEMILECGRGDVASPE